MASVANSFMKIFRCPSAGRDKIAGPAQKRKRLPRRSSGLAELAKSFASEEPLCVLDLGSTSAANIRYLTGRGHKLYSEDLLVASTEPSLATKDEAGKPALDSKRFLSDNLAYGPVTVAWVLCCNLARFRDISA